MQVTVTTIILGSPEGERIENTSLTLPASTLTLRELLAHRAQLAEDKKTETNRGTAGNQPANAEPEYMVVIDNRRIVDPDTVLTLRPDTRIEFIKVLPLVGG